MSEGWAVRKEGMQKKSLTYTKEDVYDPTVHNDPVMIRLPGGAFLRAMASGPVLMKF